MILDNSEVLSLTRFSNSSCASRNSSSAFLRSVISLIVPKITLFFPFFTNFPANSTGIKDPFLWLTNDSKLSIALPARVLLTIFKYFGISLFGTNFVNLLPTISSGL